jgi:galactose mutarotase-like enzyme
MVKLFGQTYTRAELLPLVGDVRQIGGVTLKTIEDGAGRGVRVADVATGSGLRFSVLIDRAMDVGAADWAGRPLAWHSGAGVVHPAYYDPKGLGWLRSFPGGLMVGCGLDNVGVPTVDQGEELGLHGRLSHTPSELISYGGNWQGDEYHIWIRGRVRHYRLFSHNLVLERTIRTRLGSDQLRIEDRITNQGFEPTPFQMLYHCNFGYPVVSPDSELWVETETSAPRDEAAAAGFERHTLFEAPTPGYAEQVFLHQPKADAEGYGRVALVNQALGFGASVRFRLAELPRLIQWKMMGQGAYVVGLEPANCGVGGRAQDRADGTLRVLGPGETESLAVEIGVLPDREAVAAWKAGRGGD